jgi:type IV pilus assembly protein PilB
VFEILGLNTAIREAILHNRPQSDLRRIALENGMETLETVAKRKVLAGVTSMEEFHRVLATYAA